MKRLTSGGKSVERKVSKKIIRAMQVIRDACNHAEGCETCRYCEICKMFDYMKPYQWEFDEDYED